MKKSTIFAAITLIVIAFSISSCEESKFPYNEFVTVLTKDGPGASDAQGYPYYFVTDDSLKLYPVNHTEYPKFKPEDNSRGLAYFYKVVSEEKTANAETDSYNIELFDFGNMLVKDVLLTEKADTTGKDKITPLGIWFSGGKYGAKRMVNFRIQVLSNNLPVPHVVNLVKDIAKEGPAVDSEGYYTLDCRHNAGKNANGMYRIDDFIAFPLEEAMLEEGIVGLKITFDTLDEGVKEYKLEY